MSIIYELKLTKPMLMICMLSQFCKLHNLVYTKFLNLSFLNDNFYEILKLKNLKKITANAEFFFFNLYENNLSGKICIKFASLFFLQFFVDYSHKTCYKMCHKCKCYKVKIFLYFDEISLQNKILQT